MTTRIKICGITRQQDAETVARSGADALGLNFAAQSPRRVGVDEAARIARSVEGLLARVGLFVNAPAHEVAQVIERVDLDLLQFHGDEAGAYCRGFGKPYLKAVRVRTALDVAALADEYHDACCLLLDAYVPGRPGGTGQRFDWALWPAACEVPLVLAGGLTPDNVGEAVTRLAPWGVDVSGGVESARAGEKDAGKIHRFIDEVRRARSQ